jgi:hypothetical protein
MYIARRENGLNVCDRLLKPEARNSYFRMHERDSPLVASLY